MARPSEEVSGAATEFSQVPVSAVPRRLNHMDDGAAVLLNALL